MGGVVAVGVGEGSIVAGRMTLPALSIRKAVFLTRIRTVQ